MKPIPPRTCGVQKKTSAIAVGGDVARFGMTPGRPVLQTEANTLEKLGATDRKGRRTYSVETQKILAAHI